jgi:hypothetical protein
LFCFLGFGLGLMPPCERTLWRDLLQWIALLDLIAISGGQLDDLMSLIQTVEAELQPPPHWKQRQPGVLLWAVQPRKRLQGCDPAYT